MGRSVDLVEIKRFSLVISSRIIFFTVVVFNVYLKNNFETPNIDLMKADRLEYLNKLGMAYYDADIDASLLGIV